MIEKYRILGVLLALCFGELLFPNISLQETASEYFMRTEAK